MPQVWRGSRPLLKEAANCAFEALSFPAPYDSGFHANKSFHKVLPSLPGAVLITLCAEE